MKLPLNPRLVKGVLFCLFYVHVYDEQRVKHGDRGIPCVCLGFDDRNNQFIGMEWFTGKIHYVGDGSFHCMTFPFRANPNRVPAWMDEYDHLSPSTTVAELNPANHSLPTGPRRSYRQHGYQFTGGRAVADIPDVDIAPDDIPQNHHLFDVNSICADTPMDPGTARALMLLPVEPSSDPVSLSKFQSLVGCLLWLYKTRPDLMFVTNLLARFCRIATAAHLQLAMRPLRYLKATVDYGIVFQAGFVNDGVLSAEADADLAGDLTTSRSTSGFYAKLGQHGTVACNSSLERKISTSTGQAETYALASTVKEVVWIRHLLHDIRHPQTKPTKTRTDNQGVKIQATKAVNHATAKHYRISQAYIRSKGDDGTVEVEKVSAADNHSDFLTKALCTELFVRHRDAVMGPQRPPGVAMYVIHSLRASDG
jgi:hypothetical protein